MMPSTITRALAAVALLSIVGCAAPLGAPPPSSVEEAYRHHNRPTDKWFARGKPYADQPGNLRAEDMLALLSGTVFLERDFDERGPRSRNYRRDGLNVYVFGPDGEVGMCVSTGNESESHSLAVSRFIPETRRIEGNLYPVLASPNETPLYPDLTVENQDGYGGRLYSMLYDPETGVAVVFNFTTNKFNPRNSWYWEFTGHLQERLPASVYTLCPDFPSAEDLGFEVNAAQTATGYRELVQQDPGRRIMRPDLVTPDARLTYR